MKEVKLSAPTVVLLSFEQSLRPTQKQCRLIDVRVNGQVQSASARLLFATDYEGRIKSSRGTKLKYCVFDKKESRIISKLSRPNSIAIKTIRPMSLYDIGQLFWILDVFRDKMGLPKIPKMPDQLEQKVVAKSVVWIYHCGNTSNVERTTLQPSRNHLIEECPICFEVPSQRVALVPCGHAIYCPTCVESLSKCALCRTKIQSHLLIYQ